MSSAGVVSVLDAEALWRLTESGPPAGLPVIGSGGPW
jgi:hypothetical protein